MVVALVPEVLGIFNTGLLPIGLQPDGGDHDDDDAAAPGRGKRVGRGFGGEGLHPLMGAPQASIQSSWATLVLASGTAVQTTSVSCAAQDIIMDARENSGYSPEVRNHCAWHHLHRMRFVV